MPHADVLFFSKQYALSQNAAYTTPRPFLLAIAATGRVPAHALLVAYWGSAGAALLSVPTREYLQSSGWVDDEPMNMRPLSTMSVNDPNNTTTTGSVDQHGVGSVRSGSGFWAAGHRSGSGTSSSVFTAFSSSNGHGSGQDHTQSSSNSGAFRDSWFGMDEIPEGRAVEGHDEEDHDSQGTEVGNNGDKGGGGPVEGKKRRSERDELSAQDAFIAGMIYALSQRILPGAPFTPSATPYAHTYAKGSDLVRGR